MNLPVIFAFVSFVMLAVAQQDNWARVDYFSDNFCQNLSNVQIYPLDRCVPFSGSSQMYSSNGTGIILTNYDDQNCQGSTSTVYFGNDPNCTYSFRYSAVEDIPVLAGFTFVTFFNELGCEVSNVTINFVTIVENSPSCTPYTCMEYYGDSGVAYQLTCDSVYPPVSMTTSFVFRSSLHDRTFYLRCR
eukprot:TRINITY_DN160_c0_g1_i3.p1 TRINITY_DN160_c0_g1~~TRINITY_DN160_c0_g1_i3.p1  ORF type:complete len:188 (-),score=8.82 TRINITY_DN160_c0_g1_i3:310-873(-)